MFMRINTDTDEHKDTGWEGTHRLIKRALFSLLMILKMLVFHWLKHSKQTGRGTPTNKQAQSVFSAVNIRGCVAMMCVTSVHGRMCDCVIMMYFCQVCICSCLLICVYIYTFDISVSSWSVSVCALSSGIGNMIWGPGGVCALQTEHVCERSDISTPGWALVWLSWLECHDPAWYLIISHWKRMRYET